MGQLDECKRKNHNLAQREVACTTGVTGGLRRVLNVLKGLLNFFVANRSPLHPLPPVVEKVETIDCFSICKSRSLLVREILVCQQRPRGRKRVPKDNHNFQYPWNLVLREIAPRSFI